MAGKNKKVVLVSLDPAHNLFDAFKISTSKESIAINDNLYLEEIDIDAWIKKYLETIENQVSQSYQYLTSLGLEKHLEIIKYSPGMEEYALIFAYQSILKKYEDFDYLIFDMPPTALALRFFNLPGLSLVWLEKLIQIRRQILEKKNIIETVKAGKKKSSHDKTLDHLLQLQKEHEKLDSYFKHKNQTRVCVILNNDELSFAESVDIKTKLSTQDVTVQRYIINKSDGDRENYLFNRDINPISTLPSSSKPLLGIEMFDSYCHTPEFIRYLSEIFS